MLLYNLQDYIISFTSNFMTVSQVVLLLVWRNKYFWIACHSPDTTWADQTPWHHVLGMMTGRFHIHYKPESSFHDLNKNVRNNNPLNDFIIPARKLAASDWWSKDTPQSPTTSLHVFLYIFPVSDQLWPFLFSHFFYLSASHIVFFSSPSSIWLAICSPLLLFMSLSAPLFDTGLRKV